MYDQQGGESDEDCEVYFLKPVNEYNIVDKIKEANKELFSLNSCEQKSIEDLEIDEAASTKDQPATFDASFAATTTTTIRKVTFAPNLEDYEPETDASAAAENGATAQDAEEAAEANFNEIKRLKIKNGIEKFPTIDEQEECSNPAESLVEELKLKNDDELNEENVKHPRATTLGEASEAKQKNSKNLTTSTTSTTALMMLDDDDDVDEICEEIIIMEMDGATTTTTTTTSTKEDSLENRRLLHNRQITFDYNEEQDNKSLTNLLTASDCEEEQQAYTDDSDAANDASIFMGIDDFDIDVDQHEDVDNNNIAVRYEHDFVDDDDDDDDKLSLIVASYLPDDYERKVNLSPSSLSSLSPSAGGGSGSGKALHANSYSYFRRNCKSSSAKQRNPSSSATATTTSNSNSNSNSSAASSSSTFCRRFHLRRKAHSTNSIGAMCDGDDVGGNGSATTQHTNPNRHHSDKAKADITDLKLNYKTCCEYRNSIQGKLPKYTGYLSEYGLSREQLQQREQQLQKKQRFVLEQTLRANEDEIRKMQDNERAFTTWLKNKMRFPINKTRNMFDVKLNLSGRRKTKTTNNASLIPTTTTTTTTSEQPTATTTTATTPTNNNYKNKRRSPFGCTAK